MNKINLLKPKARILFRIIDLDFSNYKKPKGFKVSDTAYFVYVNGKQDAAAFDGKLEFDVTLIAHKGDDSWIEGILGLVKECLENQNIPLADEDCEYCSYRELVKKTIVKNYNNNEFPKTTDNDLAMLLVRENLLFSSIGRCIR